MICSVANCTYDERMYRRTRKHPKFVYDLPEGEKIVKARCDDPVVEHTESHVFIYEVLRSTCQRIMTKIRMSNEYKITSIGLGQLLSKVRRRRRKPKLCHSDNRTEYQGKIEPYYNTFILMKTRRQLSPLTYATHKFLQRSRSPNRDVIQRTVSAYK